MGSWASSLTADQALTKVLLALLLGGLVGLEREWHGRAAGLRTHVMVCLGSVILVIGARAAGDAVAGGNVARAVFDPNRIAAGIVTGIGFLGAGAILRMGDLIRGLTTAACIWFVAALGVVLGGGMFGLAIFSTLIALLVLVALDTIEHRIPPLIYRAVAVSAQRERWQELEDACLARLHNAGVRVQEVLRRIDTTQDAVEITFHIRARSGVSTRELIADLSAQDGVRSVRWDHK